MTLLTTSTKPYETLRKPHRNLTETFRTLIRKPHFRFQRVTSAREACKVCSRCRSRIAATGLMVVRCLYLARGERCDSDYQ